MLTSGGVVSCINNQQQQKLTYPATRLFICSHLTTMFGLESNSENKNYLRSRVNFIPTQNIHSIASVNFIELFIRENCFL